MDEYTKLLLLGEGTDGSTTIVDSSQSQHVATKYGNVQIDTAQKVFGDASILFDGSGDYLTFPDSEDWNFGTGDFTIDFRVRASNWNGTHCAVFEIGNYTSDGIIFQRNIGGPLYYAQNNNLKSIAWSPSTNTWYHVAIVRQGRYTKIYIDGVLLTTFDFTTSQNITCGTSGLRIGNNLGGGNFLNGWIDEFRISKGVARWTANFTPPTETYYQAAAGQNPKTKMCIGLGLCG